MKMVKPQIGLQMNRKDLLLTVTIIIYSNSESKHILHVSHSANLLEKKKVCCNSTVWPLCQTQTPAATHALK